MQFQIVYFKLSGFLGYLIPYVFSGIWLSSSNSVFFFWGGKCKLFKLHLFNKKFKIVNTQDLYTDYDVYVKIAQWCLKETTEVNHEWVNFCGSNLIHKILFYSLSNDTDYKHLPSISTNEIKEMNPKKLKSYFSSVIEGITIDL